MSTFAEEFGQRLAAARTAAGMTQDQLGDQVGLTRSSIANVESGRQGVSAEQVIQHAAALGIDPTWLLTGRGPDQAAMLDARISAARAAEQVNAMAQVLRAMSDQLRALAGSVTQ